MRDEVDLRVLVDIISNVAGMMILLACMAIMLRQEDAAATRPPGTAKPLSFPLAYLPDKRSLPLCLKYGRLYQLPERQLLEALSERTSRGEVVEWLTLTDEGVDARLDLAATCTGFRFQYHLRPEGGLPVADRAALVKTLEGIVATYPAKRFFYVVHTWPTEFEAFREIREFLHERGIEVGWQPRPDWGGHDTEPYDVVYSIGEYADDLSTIKAQ